MSPICESVIIPLTCSFLFHNCTIAWLIQTCVFYRFFCNLFLRNISFIVYGHLTTIKHYSIKIAHDSSVNRETFISKEARKKLERSNFIEFLKGLMSLFSFKKLMTQCKHVHWIWMKWKTSFFSFNQLMHHIWGTLTSSTDTDVHKMSPYLLPPWCCTNLILNCFWAVCLMVCLT